jgi:hypothetical protein
MYTCMISTCTQGCQMVCFQTKSPNLGKFWRVLDWKMLVYFMDAWSILRSFVTFNGHLVYIIRGKFGILCREKSGNPACTNRSALFLRNANFWHLTLLFARHFFGRKKGFRLVQRNGPKYGTMTPNQGCQIFLGPKYQKNIPNYHNIYQMAIKYFLWP